MGDEIMQLGLDKRTFFPCVAIGDSGSSFVSMLPLTKVQVEQFIWERWIDDRQDEAPFEGTAAHFTKEFARLTDEEVFFFPASGKRSGQIKTMREQLRALLEPAAITESVDRLEGGRYEFDHDEDDRPTPLTNLRRQSLSQTSPPEALLATNLWHCIEEYNYSQLDRSPQRWSSVDVILRWLGAQQMDAKNCLRGRLPTLSEYGKILTSYKEFSSLHLMDACLKLRGLDNGARCILKLLCRKHKTRFSEENGLPFLANGVWELTSELTDRTVLAGPEEDSGTKRRPVAVGRSRFLPGMVPGANGVMILIEHHPAIGFRPVFPADAVEAQEIQIRL